ncbi:MAG: LuxR C-terminal-related transcriptional regulator, partial [Bacteroidota bacterium]
ISAVFSRDLLKAECKEYSLFKSLEKTAEILNLETGWIWLTEPDNTSVYLAVSHNLPPALSNYPERLSGWCYCIKQYLSDDMEEAVNISEIACSRLKDINSGTNDLRFHATIPITIEGEKVGLINLLSQESRKLDEQELTILNTIGELVGTCVQRARLQTSFVQKKASPESDLKRISEKVILPQLEATMASLKSEMGDGLKVKAALQELIHLQRDLTQLLKEANNLKSEKKESNAFSYPKNPITKRELQVLTLIKEGLTNEAIGNRLHITERTVKFHITSILSKLNAKNRTEAVDIALKRGLFSV